MPDYSVFATGFTALTYLSLSGYIKGVDQLAGLRQLNLFQARLEDDILAGIAVNLTRLTRFDEHDCWMSERAVKAGLLEDSWLGEGEGEGKTYTYEEDYDWSVCEQLTDDLTRVGILPLKKP